MAYLGIFAKISGPFSDGRVDRELDAAANEFEQEIALDYGVLLIEQMESYFQNSTPYYSTRVEVEPERGHHVVHDSGVIYGPWLAGTGSRNAPVTRFRGYPHWRNTTRIIRSRAKGIAIRVLKRHVGRL